MRPDDAVLEFGGRFGTTSCRLARATRNSGRVVSVEPDPTVLRPLLRNLFQHKCSVNVVAGTVSSVGLTIQAGRSYSSSTRPVAELQG